MIKPKALNPQVRRLDACIAQCGSQAQISPLRLEAARKTWSSIVRAPGFQPSFPRWWLSEFNQPCPIDLPPRQVMQYMRHKLVQCVPEWRQTLTATQSRTIHKVFSEDWQKGGKFFFKAISSPPCPPVDAIDRVAAMLVQALRTKEKGHALFKLLNDDFHCVAIGQHWTQLDAQGVVVGFRGLAWPFQIRRSYHAHYLC